MQLASWGLHGPGLDYVTKNWANVRLDIKIQCFLIQFIFITLHSTGFLLQFISSSSRRGGGYWVHRPSCKVLSCVDANICIQRLPVDLWGG